MLTLISASSTASRLALCLIGLTGKKYYSLLPPVSLAFCLDCISLMHQSFPLMMKCSGESLELQLNSEEGISEKGNTEPHCKEQLQKPRHTTTKVMLS